MPRKVVRKSKKVKRKLKKPKRKGTKKKKLSGLFSRRSTKVQPRNKITKYTPFDQQVNFLKSKGDIKSNRIPNLSIFSTKRNYSTPNHRTKQNSPNKTQNLTKGATSPPLHKRGNRSLPPLPLSFN